MRVLAFSQRPFLSRFANLLGRNAQTGTTKSYTSIASRNFTISPFLARGFRREARHSPTVIKTRDLSIAGAAALGCGGICLYGIYQSYFANSADLSILSQTSIWPNYVKERVQATFLYIAGTTAIIGASSYCLLSSPAFCRVALSGGWMFPIGMLVSTIGAQYVCQTLPYPSSGLSAKHAAWVAYSTFIGATLAPLIVVAGSAALTQAAIYTGAIVTGLSVVSASAPSTKFLNWGGPLSIGLGVVFASSLGSVFLSPATRLGFGLHSLALYGGLAVFSGLLLYDTQMLIKRAEQYPHDPSFSQIRPFDPINNSIQLTLDILNIFVRMVQIVMGGNNRRK